MNNPLMPVFLNFEQLAFLVKLDRKYKIIFRKTAKFSLNLLIRYFIFLSEYKLILIRLINDSFYYY